VPTTPRESRLYSLRDLVTLTGAKRSQVENWNRAGVLAPQIPSTGTGDFRAYGFPDLVACAVAVQLARFHMPAPAIKRIINDLLALATEVSDNRSRAKFLKTWRAFINPETRTRTMDPILMYTPEGVGTVSILEDIRFPDGDTFVGVAVGAIIRGLERATGDRWSGVDSEYGARPTRKRKQLET
jgi:hypothetical protein